MMDHQCPVCFAWNTGGRWCGCGPGKPGLEVVSTMRNRLADPQRRATCEAVYFAHLSRDWSPQDNEMLKADPEGVAMITDFINASFDQIFEQSFVSTRVLEMSKAEKPTLPVAIEREASFTFVYTDPYTAAYSEGGCD